MTGARLHVTDILGQRTVPLDKATFTIGRRSTSDLQVVSEEVSRDHAVIAHLDGRFTLRDRGS